jgi:hypothetical protein
VRGEALEVDPRGMLPRGEKGSFDGATAGAGARRSRQ